MLKLEYELTGKGWATASIDNGDQRAEHRISYIGPGLEELLQAALGLTENKRRTIASFEDEPGENRWVFRVERVGTVFLVISFYDHLFSNPEVEEDERELRKREDLPEDDPDDPAMVLFAAYVHLPELLQAVSAAAEAVLEKYGAAGYKTEWLEGDFPEEELRKLQEYLVEKNSPISS